VSRRARSAELPARSSDPAHLVDPDEDGGDEEHEDDEDERAAAGGGGANGRSALPAAASVAGRPLIADALGIDAELEALRRRAAA